MKRQIAATVAALMSISLLAPAVYAEETVPIAAPETVIATAESAETALTAANDIPAFYADGANAVASGTCGDKLTWTLDDAGTLTISGTGKMSNEWLLDYQKRKNVKAVVIEDGVTSISDSAFSSCTELETVAIPETLELIDVHAFFDCSALTTIDIPASVTAIGKEAFWGCDSLTSIQVDENNPNYCSADGVLFTKSKNELIIFPTGKKDLAYTIPDGVTSIDGYAFYTCATLKNVALPNSLEEIGGHVFYGCSSLTTVNIPAGVTAIGEEAFSQCSSLTEIRVDENNPNYCAVDGVLFAKDQKRLVTYPGGKKGTSYTVPDGVIALENGAFRECAALKRVDLPNSLESIGEYTFYACEGLKSIALPDSITKIDTAAFARCTSLTSVHLPYNLKELGTDVFWDCSALPELFIPEGITSIPSFTFCYCTNLQKVTIPKSVTYVGFQAFRDCSALTDVYFTGTEEEWNQVEVSDNGGSGGFNEPLINATKHFNSPSIEPPFITPDDNPFPDVSKDNWFYEDALYVSENNLMNGIPNAEGETCFEPDASTSRAMVVTILYRMSGCPEVSEANNFSDVENDSWYTDAVIWASENGIVTGYAGTNQFGTNDPITREQMAVMMYRYAQYNGKDTSASASLDSFTDCEQVHSWAKDAFAWANAEGLIGGKPTDDGKFFLDPAGNAVRSQAAAILHRYCENI